MTGNRLLLARVHGVRTVARGVASFDLRPDAAGGFPAFTAGAHIDLHTPGGIVRSYSLHNNPGDRDRYEVGVQLDRASRGGSRWLHENLKAGALITVSAPRNNFPLVEDAAHSVFVAGGIGVTPILSMLQRLAGLGKTAHLYYCARSRADAAFLDEIGALPAGLISTHHHFDEECGRLPDMQALLGAHPASSQFYCCGPAPMLDAFEDACAKLALPNAHLERFQARAQSPAAALEGTCSVLLARSGRRISVPKNTPLLPELVRAGVQLDYSCEEGVCGSCEVRMLGGEADHRDSVLGQAQKKSNSAIMVCVSRCRSDEVVLDL